MVLGPNDPAPVEVIPSRSDSPLLLACDHAGRAIPRAMGTLGLDESVLDRHIAYDIGAADLTRLLAKRLGAPAVLACYSRLLLDVNRQPGDPQSIPHLSDGVPIPGNQNLSEPEMVARAHALHRPYHQAITDALAHLWRIGPPPALFSVHSFTPRLMTGEERRWDVGVLWNRDYRMAMPLIDALRSHAGLRVGDNEPYSGKVLSYTMDRHAGAAGLPHCAVEIRQDHLGTAGGVIRWADMLADALAPLVGKPSLHRVEHFR